MTSLALVSSPAPFQDFDRCLKQIQAYRVILRLELPRAFTMARIARHAGSYTSLKAAINPQIGVLTRGSYGMASQSCPMAPV